MSSEQFMDEVVIEDFQEEEKSLVKLDKKINFCKTELSNIILRNKNPNSAFQSKYKSINLIINPKSLGLCEMKLSRCLDNLDRHTLTDTISLGSDSIEETCSGSSLHKLDFPNDSDSFDDMILEKQGQFDERSLRYVSYDFVNELHVPKIMDGNEGSVEEHGTERSEEGLFMVSEQTMLVENEKTISPTKLYGCTFHMTLTSIPKIKDSITMHLFKLRYTASKNIKEHNHENKKPTTKQRKVRSKSEGKLTMLDESFIRINQLHIQNVQQSHKIEYLLNKNKSLIYEINNRERIIEEMQHKEKEAAYKSNCTWKSALESLNGFKRNSIESELMVQKYEIEITNLRKANENLKMLKANAESIIRKEQYNNEVLIERMKSFSEMEQDHQWLYNAFLDYKSLGKDYDTLQFHHYETQHQLNNSLKSIELLKSNIVSLENELFSHKAILNEIKKNSHQTGKTSKIKHKSFKSKKSECCDEGDQSTTNFVDESRGNLNPEILENLQPDIKELERKYDNLQLKKRALESELCHVPISGVSSIRQSHAALRGEKEYIENELDLVDQEISSIRRTLKQYHVMGDRSLK